MKCKILSIFTRPRTILFCMKKYLFVCFLLLPAANLFAQNFLFQSVTSKDGLSQNDVNCILQDNMGFMWFGTNDGLNRFDGYDFKSYHFDVDTNNGLNSNLINCIAEDNYGNIWVGTSDSGVNIINRLDDSIISVSESSENLLSKENIYAIEMVNNMVIVFAKENIFFFEIMKEGYKPLRVNGNTFIKTGAFATNCYERLSENEFLLGGANKLLQFKISATEDGVAVKFTEIKKWLNVSDIGPFRKGHLISCKGRLFYLNESLELEFIDYRNFSSVFVKNNQEVWAGSKSGFHILNFESDTSLTIAQEQVYTRKNTNNTLSSDAISIIYPDNKGIIWLGTAGGGVCKLIVEEHKFKLYKDDLSSENLMQNNINCFLEDSKNNLWIGTDKEGISFFKSGVTNYNAEAKEILDLGKPVHDLIGFYEVVFDTQPCIIATTNYPLNIQTYDLSGDKLNVDHPFLDFLKKIAHPITSIVKDKTTFWIGTNEGGILRYNLKDGDFKRFLTNNTPSLSSNLIKSLCKDKNDNFWIGTNKGLLFLSATEKHKNQPEFKLYHHNEADANSISYDYVLPIVETSQKELWVGTLGGGLNKYIPKTDTFERITTNNGLPNNSIKSIVEDNEGQLWVSTNSGVSRINPFTKEVLNFSVSDGLQDYEFREKSAFKRRSGELLFGGNKGFNSFLPEDITIDTTMPKLVFTKMLIPGYEGNEDLIFNHAQILDFQENEQTITLKHNKNNFTAYFSALHYLAPQKINYKYRLKGFEEQWNKIDAKARFAKYTNLNPGYYTLEVLATNSDGIWQETPLNLNIQIKKPWYGTTLAYFVYFILSLLGLYVFNRYSLIRNNIKQQLVIQGIEKEKEKELAQAKLRFFTNISHELRTPLAVIKSYCENVIPNWNKLPETKVNNDFSVIQRNVDNLLGLVNQILDFRKLEAHKIKLSPVNKDIVSFVKDIISTFEVLALQKKIQISFQSNKEVVHFWFDEDKMHKIISNILSNAVKYTSSGIISVIITELEAEVELQIKDTGIGISEANKEKVFERFFSLNNPDQIKTNSSGIGLSLTKGLVNLHKGTIELDSKFGVGSTFTLRFKKGNTHFEEDVIFKPLNLEEKAEVEEVEIVDSDVKLTPNERLILIVEDNDDLRYFLNDKLQAHFKTSMAKNGKEGLDKCLNMVPDLVISDVMMPEMNGYELCNAIKNDEAISHIPVILLTARTTSEAKLKGFNLGADAYVNKPFEWNILLSQISAILSAREKVWKRINENPYFKPSEVTFTSRDEHFLNRITGIIEDHLSNPDFNVKLLTDIYGGSQDTINQKLKALTGKTCVQYIRLIRLRRAAELLKQKHNRVSDVTYEVGYSDLQHFREHFKKEFEVSPSAYKKQHTKA